MVSVTNLVLVTLLGGLTVFLGTVVLTFQFLLVQKRARLSTLGPNDSHPMSSSNNNKNKNLIDTVKPAEETRHLQLYKKKNTLSLSAEAYWNQVLPYLQWDAVLYGHDEENTAVLPRQDALLLPPPTTHTLTALQEAARLGHSQAQYYMANALVSGILPFPLPHYNMTIDESMSHVYWHMAAMDGHVASALAMGYRRHDEDTSSSCEAALPYYQEAANNIMDTLESSKHSRAKVTPAIDTHVLSEVYAQGAASQHSWNNQPDEPADALKYYHMRALAGDVQAAYTLAHLHHYGLRGVVQNLTLSLEYYEMAAPNHLEAAGQAGKFHVWGIGMDWNERNLVKAHSYFIQEDSYEVCKSKWRQAQLQKHSSTQVCDHASLNGLGILYVLGMPLLLPVDKDKAIKYFELARDMGNMDASYNLAMVRLGYTNFKPLVDDEHMQQQSMRSLPNFLAENSPLPSKADYLVALQELVAAANKGHLQARHRLGLMYAHGITLDGNLIIAQDCTKALKHFKWIAQNANPFLGKYTRRAYKYFASGNWEGALYNYLAAAEMGHQGSQVNAAFLLEQGVCLSLSSPQCAAASLRLWKAAVQTNPEAALRVGDVYYYGRLRHDNALVGPFWWLPYMLYPEQYVWPLVQRGYQGLVEYITGKQVVDDKTVEETCDADGTCLATEEEEDHVKSDLEMAARYYRLAAEMHKSPRANFNLGFVYEWGLGVKQDFPLAKRHYDLAQALQSGEADLAVQIALVAMNVHERIVKLYMAFEEWRDKRQSSKDSDDEHIPMAAYGVGHPVPSAPATDEAPKTKTHVIIKHLLSWESLLIVILTIVLSKLLQHRRTP